MINTRCSSRRESALIMTLLAWLFVALAVPRAWGAAEIKPERVAEIAAMLPPNPTAFGQPITDRAAWAKLARLPAFANVVSNAEALAEKAVPALPDDLYLDFSRTGNRDRCQRVLFERGSRLMTLTLAECFEDRGRFVRPLSDTLDALFAERTWVYPAHDGKLNNFYGRTVEMDLRATALAWELATADYLLADKLPEATRHALRENVQRRVLKPFRDMVEGRRPEISWMRANHNWNAVCLAGVTGAALALDESKADRAWFVAAAEHYIEFFLSGFTPDGYCSEGIGYWNYGFGHFLMLSEAIRQATGNRIELLAEPAARQPALFCFRTEILNGVYPTISDCHPGSRPDPQFEGFICQRLNLEAPSGLHADLDKPATSLVATILFTSLEALSDQPHSGRPTSAKWSDFPLRTWFKDGGVLICRPAPKSPLQFAVALKGGNNAEHHNHNDVGSFSVVAGKTMVICDPGSETYTARTFSAHRYDSKVLNSYGHAVPVVAGQLQRTGADARAIVKRTDFTDASDTLELDIRSAYEVPELRRLDRTFVFKRKDPAMLTVRDEVAFSEPRTFEEALITWGHWKNVSDTDLLITDGLRGVLVKIDTGRRPFKIGAETLNEDVPTPTKPLRLGITLLAPIKEATVTLTITPVTLN